MKEEEKSALEGYDLYVVELSCEDVVLARSEHEAMQIASDNKYDMMDAISASNAHEIRDWNVGCYKDCIPFSDGGVGS